MKHPGHSTAKNEYAGRKNTKLTKSAKQELNEELREFNARVKLLLKDKK